MSNIEAEIDPNHPIECEITWKGGGAHCVVIDGYNVITNSLSIEDPYYGPSTVDFNTFISAYQGSGTWYYRFYVQP
jgi:hypothetical protein